MRLFSASIAICLWGIVVANITDDYEKEKIIPDVLDKAPETLLQVEYDGKAVEFGKELKLTETKSEPTIKWDFDPSSFYTLIMNDPDAPSKEIHILRELLHWSVVNIPKGDVSKGEVLAGYMQPAPPLLTGSHRYCFTLLKQPSKLDFDETHLNNQTLLGRNNFSIRKFAQKYKLSDPIAGNMFKAHFQI